MMTAMFHVADKSVHWVSLGMLILQSRPIVNRGVTLGGYKVGAATTPTRVPLFDPSGVRYAKRVGPSLTALFLD